MAEELAQVEARRDGARLAWLMFGAAPQGVDREVYEAQARARYEERYGEAPLEVWWWSERWLYLGPVPDSKRG